MLNMLTLYLSAQLQNYATVHDGFRKVSNSGKQLCSKCVESSWFVIVSSTADYESVIASVAGVKETT